MTTLRRELARILAKRTIHAGLNEPQARSVAAYLLQSGKTSELAPLLRDVQREWIRHGLLEVVAISARPLSEAVIKDIRAEAKRLYPAVKRMTVTISIDPELIGGVRIMIGDYELDLSVRRRFERFSAAALKGAV